MQIFACKFTGSPELRAKGESLMPIQELSLRIPLLSVPGMPTNSMSAIAILSIGGPYAIGTNFPGIAFAISANGSFITRGGFSSENQQPNDSPRTPTTLVAPFTLFPIEETLMQVHWQPIHGSEGVIDGDASLTVIVA